VQQQLPLPLRLGLKLEGVLPWRFSQDLHSGNTAALRAYYDRLSRQTKPIPAGGSALDFEVHSLLGRRHIGMALWSLKSLLSQLSFTVNVVLHDDGSLSEADHSELRAHLPGVRIVDRKEADRLMRPKLEGLRGALEYRFTEVPTSDHRGNSYNMFLWSLILLDFHLLAQARKVMILDVDVLFFKQPQIIADWIRSGEDRRALYSVEAFRPLGRSGGTTAYGSKPRKTLNSGLLCFPCDLIDLQRIDTWILDNPDLMYTSPVFEQLCYSHVVRKHQDSVELPGDLYSFNYTDANCISTHFGVKRGFFENLHRVAPALLEPDVGAAPEAS
jgi:hypothetical protein